ncbi:hypothetical protein FH972_008822 [Carpinus fangiana]|uniref:Uncharacterized protein n=1 Tax=Carpinus fangiana TaxID=176857 RepID=A0A5N6R246_9ROSI|nr:hypothetical protein FH972_008822 [Carpinus fangiana]
MHRAVNGKIEKEKEDDGFECAVDIRLGDSRYFFDDWTGYFCVHCLRSLLCCFLPQCQGSVLIPPTIQFKWPPFSQPTCPTRRALEILCVPNQVLTLRPCGSVLVESLCFVDWMLEARSVVPCRVSTLGKVFWRSWRVGMCGIPTDNGNGDFGRNNKSLPEPSGSGFAERHTKCLETAMVAAGYENLVLENVLLEPRILALKHWSSAIRNVLLGLTKVVSLSNGPLGRQCVATQT